MHTSIKFLLKDKYTIYLILMAVFPMFGMCFADFSFLHQIKIDYKDANLLASFLSIFFGATAVAEFILKSFFSGRLLNKYGLKVALPILPVVLAGCVFLAISSGILYGTAGLFFSFIAFTKMIDRVVRSAIYDPSYQILYQPLHPEIRLNTQGMVEGMAKGLGFALAGVVVLIFTRFQALNLVHINILFFIILGFWVKMSISMYQEYRGSLSKMLISDDSISPRPADYNSVLNALRKIVEDEKEPNINLLLNVMAQLEPRKIPRFLQHILVGSSSELQRKILEQISNRRLLAAEQIIKEYLLSNPDLANKELFESTLAFLLLTRNLDFETLLELSQSPEAKNRTLAAILLAHSGSYKTFKILQALLHDDNPETRKAALLSSGQIGKRELWPLIIRNLFDDLYSTQAISAIRMIGEPILPELDRIFDKNTTSKNVRLKIISIYASVKGETALNLLRTRIQYPDETIRHQVFKALGKMKYHAKILDVGQIKETINEEIGITVWLMAAMSDIQKENNMPLLKEALEYELAQKKENVFLLLSMIYDSKTIRYIQDSFQTGTHEKKVYATEILDLTVSSEIKDLFLPLLDDLSQEENLRLFKDNYPQQKMNVFERLKDIINKDYLKINRWTKANAILHLEGYKENETVLLANFLHPDPFIMQNSFAILKRQNSDRFKVVLEKLNKEKVAFITKYTLQAENGIPEFLLSDKVKLVKRNRLFNSFSNPEIARMIENSTDILLGPEEEINPKNMTQDSIIFVLSGAISIYAGSRKIRQLNEVDLFWGIVNDSEDKIILRAEKTTEILLLSPELVFNTMAENSEYTQEVIGVLRNTA